MEEIVITQTQKENEWKKDKAILEQKLDLLNMQIKDLKVREENYKKFNDTILFAYNSIQTDSSKQNTKVFKELFDQYSRDIYDQKSKITDNVSNMEIENRELKHQVQSLETKLQDSLQQNEELQKKQENSWDLHKYYENILNESQQLQKQQNDLVIDQNIYYKLQEESQAKIKQLEKECHQQFLLKEDQFRRQCEERVKEMEILLEDSRRQCQTLEQKISELTMRTPSLQGNLYALTKAQSFTHFFQQGRQPLTNIEPQQLNSVQSSWALQNDKNLFSSQLSQIQQGSDDDQFQRKTQIKKLSKWDSNELIFSGGDVDNFKKDKKYNYSSMFKQIETLERQLKNVQEALSHQREENKILQDDVEQLHFIIEQQKMQQIVLEEEKETQNQDLKIQIKQLIAKLLRLEGEKYNQLSPMNTNTTKKENNENDQSQITLRQGSPNRQRILSNQAPAGVIPFQKFQQQFNRKLTKKWK